jgi:hypothetical protein
MTEITDDAPREVVLWASSEQNRVAVKAGWNIARQMGIVGPRGRQLDMNEIGVIVHAAYLAAGWDGADEDAGGGGGAGGER